MIYRPWPFRKCTSCGDVYLPNATYFSTKGRWLLFECKKCAQDRKIAYRKEYSQRWYIAHCKTLKQYIQRWLIKNNNYFCLWILDAPGLLDEYESRLNAIYKKRESEYNRLYRLNHLENRREYGRNYYNEHTEEYKKQDQKRRSVKQSLPATFKTSDWEFALSYFEGVCVYCGNGPGLFDVNWVLHQEHYIPMSKGGGYTPDNIIPACQECNFSKKDCDPKEWMELRFGKRKAKIITNRINEYFKAINENNKSGS